MTETTIKLPDRPVAWTVTPSVGYVVIVVDPSKADIRYTDDREIVIERKS